MNGLNSGPMSRLLFLFVAILPAASSFLNAVDEAPFRVVINDGSEESQWLVVERKECKCGALADYLSNNQNAFESVNSIVRSASFALSHDNLSSITPPVTIKKKVSVGFDCEDSLQELLGLSASNDIADFTASIKSGNDANWKTLETQYHNLKSQLTEIKSNSSILRQDIKAGFDRIKALVKRSYEKNCSYGETKLVTDFRALKQKLSKLVATNNAGKNAAMIINAHAKILKAENDAIGKKVNAAAQICKYTKEKLKNNEKNYAEILRSLETLNISYRLLSQSNNTLSELSPLSLACDNGSSESSGPTDDDACSTHRKAVEAAINSVSTNYQFLEKKVKKAKTENLDETTRALKIVKSVITDINTPINSETNMSSIKNTMANLAKQTNDLNDINTRLQEAIKNAADAIQELKKKKQIKDENNKKERDALIIEIENLDEEAKKKIEAANADNSLKNLKCPSQSAPMLPTDAKWTQEAKEFEKKWVNEETRSRRSDLFDQYNALSKFYSGNISECKSLQNDIIKNHDDYLAHIGERQEDLDICKEIGESSIENNKEIKDCIEKNRELIANASVGYTTFKNNTETQTQKTKRQLDSLLSQTNALVEQYNSTIGAYSKANAKLHSATASNDTVTEIYSKVNDNVEKMQKMRANYISTAPQCPINPKTYKQKSNIITKNDEMRIVKAECDLYTNQTEFTEILQNYTTNFNQLMKELKTIRDSGNYTDHTQLSYLNDQQDRMETIKNQIDNAVQDLFVHSKNFNKKFKKQMKRDALIKKIDYLCEEAKKKIKAAKTENSLENLKCPSQSAPKSSSENKDTDKKCQKFATNMGSYLLVRGGLEISTNEYNIKVNLYERKKNDCAALLKKNQKNLEKYLSNMNTQLGALNNCRYMKNSVLKAKFKEIQNCINTYNETTIDSAVRSYVTLYKNVSASASKAKDLLADITTLVKHIDATTVAYSQGSDQFYEYSQILEEISKLEEKRNKSDEIAGETKTRLGIPYDCHSLKWTFRRELKNVSEQDERSMKKAYCDYMNESNNMLNLLHNIHYNQEIAKQKLFYIYAFGTITNQDTILDEMKSILPKVRKAANNIDELRLTLEEKTNNVQEIPSSDIKTQSDQPAEIYNRNPHPKLKDLKVQLYRKIESIEEETLLFKNRLIDLNSYICKLKSMDKVPGDDCSNEKYTMSHQITLNIENAISQKENEIKKLIKEIDAGISNNQESGLIDKISSCSNESYGIVLKLRSISTAIANLAHVFSEEGKEYSQNESYTKIKFSLAQIDPNYKISLPQIDPNYKISLPQIDPNYIISFGDLEISDDCIEKAVYLNNQYRQKVEKFTNLQQSCHENLLGFVSMSKSFKNLEESKNFQKKSKDLSTEITQVFKNLIESYDVLHSWKDTYERCIDNGKKKRF